MRGKPQGSSSSPTSQLSVGQELYLAVLKPKRPGPGLLHPCAHRPRGQKLLSSLCPSGKRATCLVLAECFSPRVITVKIALNIFNLIT